MPRKVHDKGSHARIQCILCSYVTLSCGFTSLFTQIKKKHLRAIVSAFFFLSDLQVTFLEAK